MKVELQIQSEVRNLLESVQDTVLRNVLQRVREKKLEMNEAQLPYLKRIIDASVQQAYSNGSTGLSRICSQLEKRLDEADQGS